MDYKARKAEKLTKYGWFIHDQDDLKLQPNKGLRIATKMPRRPKIIK